jgi:anti-sigma regulatory factor (Ser/Thr protein kinase)
MILKLTLDLPGDYPYLRLARRIGRTVMEDFKVDRTDVDDVEFVLGELCSNVVRHARTSDGRFVVEFEYGADAVAVNVIDKGIGFSFKDVQPVGATRADFDGSSRIGGFGLDLCRKLADHLEFQRSDKDGTSVRAVKQLHYVSHHDAAEAQALDQASPGGLITVSGANNWNGR